MEKVSPNDLKDAREFSVLVGWHGPEDKPFYKAMLVSQSRASSISNKQPFWGYAIITTDELNRILEIVTKKGLALIAGPYVGTEPEYYLALDSDSRQCHCSLGFTKVTLDVLNQIASALATDRRKPILDIVTRIQSFFP